MRMILAAALAIAPLMAKDGEPAKRLTEAAAVFSEVMATPDKGIPEEMLVAVTRTVRRVALGLREALKPDGLNIIQNNGEAAGQTVFHYHVHLIPRWEGDHAVRLWVPGQADQDELRAAAEQIRQAIEAST